MPKSYRFGLDQAMSEVRIPFFLPSPTVLKVVQSLTLSRIFEILGAAYGHSDPFLPVHLLLRIWLLASHSDKESAVRSCSAEDRILDKLRTKKTRVRLNPLLSSFQ